MHIYEILSLALQAVAKELQVNGVITEKWRGEEYGAREFGSFDNEIAFRLERCASTFFGITQFGCHVNGYVQTKAQLSLWIATRDASKQIAPNKLDTITGGGLPLDISPHDNMLKEIQEEAGLIPEESALCATGVISYVNDEMRGFKHGTMVYTFSVVHSGKF